MTPTAFAFFDFDDTLAKGDSVLPYLLYCIKKGHAPFWQIFKAAFAFIRWKIDPTTGAAAKEVSMSFMKGKTVEEMNEIARGFFREYRETHFFQDGLKELDRLRAAGVTPVIVSASADVYMRVLPEFMPVEAAMGTLCEVQDGRYTGRVGKNCKAEEKTRRIAEWLKERGQSIDRAASSGYGDSATDAPMLLLTGQPVLVNPKKKLVARIPEGRVVHWK